MWVLLYTFCLNVNNYINFTNLLDFSNFYNNNIFKKLIFYFTNVYCNTLIFVIILCFLKLMFKKIFSTHKLSYIVFFIFLFNFNFFNLQWCVDDFFVFINFSFENKTLQNGVLLFHPIITYSAYVLIFFRKKIINDLFYGFFFLSNNFFFIKFDLVFNLTSLLLGSIWASQEIGWGGFWNWDPIELILVFFCVVIITYMHEFSNPIKLLEFFYLLNFLTLYLLIFLLMVRLDLFKSIHTFIVFTDAIKLNFIYFISVFFIFVRLWNYFLFYKIYFFGFFFKSKVTFKKTFSFFYFYIFYIILIYLMLTSPLTDFFNYEVEILQLLIIKFIMCFLGFILWNKLIFFKIFFKSFDLKLNFFLCIFFSIFFFYIFFLYFYIYIVYLIFASIFFIFLKKINNVYYFFLNRFSFNLFTHSCICFFVFLNFSRDGFVEDFINFKSFFNIKYDNYLLNNHFYLNDLFNFYRNNEKKFFNFYKNTDYRFDDSFFSDKSLYLSDSVVYMYLSNICSDVFFFIEDIFYVFFSNKLFTTSIVILFIFYMLVNFCFLKNYLFYF